jgi:subtilase family serine protease
MVPAVAAVAVDMPTVPAVVRPMIEPLSVPSATAAEGMAQKPQVWSESAPWGLGPRQFAAAYGLGAISFGSSVGTGAGQTIAIVDAYDDPALVDSTAPQFSTSDLAQFDRQYGLPDPPSFVKLNESGGTAGLPGVDPAGAGTPGNWEEETVLDVEWAHAMAPEAAIILVECNSSSSTDLYQGVKTAAGLPGVSVVSMSWGSAEYAGESAFDGDFTAPAGHQGVTFVAATGDTGAPGLYPAYSPNVLAVGGTTLTLQSGGGYGGESGWSDGGGGTSVNEPEPAYQASVQATGQRTIPDVALDADPQSGVSVYDSYDDANGDGPWMKTGGTSLAAPGWAALIAIADQGRTAAGGTTLDGATQVLPALYALPTGDFHDVTTGGNDVFNAGPGYDESTGLGSPSAGLVAPALAYYDLAPWLAITSGPPLVVTAGQPFDMTVEVENPDGSPDANFVGSVTIGLEYNPGGAALDSTLTVPARGGYATFTGLTLTRAADGYTILAVSGGGPAATATAPFTVTPAAAAQLAIAPSSTSGGLTIAVVDGYGNLETSFAGSVIVEWGTGAGPAAAARHTRHSATASAGVASFTHLKPESPARGLVLQAAADGLTATTVLPRPDRTAARSVHTQARAGHVHLDVAAARHESPPARSHHHRTAG